MVIDTVMGSGGGGGGGWRLWQRVRTMEEYGARRRAVVWV